MRKLSLSRWLAGGTRAHKPQLLTCFMAGTNNLCMGPSQEDFQRKRLQRLRRLPGEVSWHYNNTRCRRPTQQRVLCVIRTLLFGPGPGPVFAPSVLLFHPVRKASPPEPKRPPNSLLSLSRYRGRRRPFFSLPRANAKKRTKVREKKTRGGKYSGKKDIFLLLRCFSSCVIALR